MKPFDLKAAAEMALEALEFSQKMGRSYEIREYHNEIAPQAMYALRQALAEPDKHIKELRANLNRMRHFQEWGEVGFATGERIAGYNAAVDEMLEHLREMGLDDDTGTDRGAWADVPDATKWVDELRGDDEEWTPEDMAYRPSGLSLEEPPNSTTDVVEPIGEIQTEQMGANAMRAIVHFYNEPPPVGTKLYATPPKTNTEPVAWVVPDFGFLFPDEISAQRYLDNTESGAKPTPLYTAPPQREWVGLTDEDYKALEIETLVSNMGYREVLRWADKRLKEKNHVD